MSPHNDEHVPDHSDAGGQSRRRDIIPIAVMVLFLLFGAFQIFNIAGQYHSTKPNQSDGLDDKATQSLIETDLLAKTAYAISLKDNSPVVHPDPHYLQLALKSSYALLKESPNSPGAARRVIILQALSGLKPLTAPKKYPAPLSAYANALSPDVSAADRASFTIEANIWQSAFTKELTPNQTDALANEIKHDSIMRWWEWPALSALYNAQNDPSEANRYALAARAHAATPLATVGALLFLRGAFFFAGIIIFAYLIWRTMRKGDTQSPHTTDNDLWPTVPEQIPFSERRLGAGDLMAVFVIYITTQNLLGVLLVGSTGLGAHHAFHLPGLLTPFLGTVKKMSDQQQAAIETVLESLAYLLSATPPLLYLNWLCKKRGASLGQELGWTVRKLKTNIIYGFAGFAIASMLIIVASVLAPEVFRNAPDPSNPVIPELINSSGLWSMVLLTALASVAAPLIEELLFRGVLYNALKLKIGIWPAIVSTGLIFGFMHPVGIVEMVAISVLGGVFAWMAETRKSLVPSITAHCLNNLSSTLLLLAVLSR